MARKSVGRRSVKRSREVNLFNFEDDFDNSHDAINERPSRSREVNLFNFEDDLGNFHDPIVEDIEGRPRVRRKIKNKNGSDPARTTRDLTTVAIALPLAGVATSLVSTL